MALNIRLCAEVNPYCNQLTIKDITGVYSLTTNPNGWGAPNPDPSAITEYTITVTTVTDTYEFDAMGIFPDNPLYIPNSEIGDSLGTTQIISISAYVLAPEIYEDEIELFTYCEQTNIIKNLFDQLATPGCCSNCTTEKQCLVMSAYNYYLTLEFAAKTGNQNRFNELIKVINTYDGLDICKC